MGHLSQNELAALVDDAKQHVTVGARYQHYKGAEFQYTVLNIALIEANNEPAVVYQAEYGARVIFVRPVSVWLEMVEWQGKQVPRFTKVGKQ